MIQLFINGQSVCVIEGTSVAAALAQAKSYSRLS
ncbi:(2Fe-2S)-binding protein, partial [Escherichia coli]